MASMNLQDEPPERKRSRKKKRTTHSSTPPPPPPPSSSSPSFSLLPDEIAVNCLARISRAYYPRFSIISKSFRSLLSSMELYLARSQIGSTEQCLYVCLSDESYQYSRWFTLWINPNPTLPNSTIKKKKTLRKSSSLAPIPSSHFPSVSESALVVGSDIYVIGGPIKTEPVSKERSRLCPSSAVRVLDCRTHTWRDAPSMILARKHALTCFHNGKIYVMGGCKALEEPWAEVYDTNTQTWKPLSDPGTEISKISRCTFYSIKEKNGKIYFGNAYETHAYDTSQDNWESIAQFQSSTWLTDGGFWFHRIPKPACLMDGVWYNISHGPFHCWWSKDGRFWKGVKGLESLREMYNRNGGSSRNKTVLVSCGGKLLLLWEGYMEHNPSNRKKIWCAEISLETDAKGEVRGNVEWIDVVQTVRTQCELLHCLVVSV